MAQKSADYQYLNRFFETQKSHARKRDSLLEYWVEA